MKCLMQKLVIDVEEGYFLLPNRNSTTDYVSEMTALIRYLDIAGKNTFEKFQLENSQGCQDRQKEVMAKVITSGQAFALLPTSDNARMLVNLLDELVIMYDAFGEKVRMRICA